jgi:hypothetical protein
MKYLPIAIILFFISCSPVNETSHLKNNERVLGFLVSSKIQTLKRKNADDPKRFPKEYLELGQLDKITDELESLTNNPQKKTELLNEFESRLLKIESRIKNQYGHEALWVESFLQDVLKKEKLIPAHEFVQELKSIILLVCMDIDDFGALNSIFIDSLSFKKIEINQDTFHILPIIYDTTKNVLLLIDSSEFWLKPSELKISKNVWEESNSIRLKVMHNWGIWKEFNIKAEHNTSQKAN